MARNASQGSSVGLSSEESWAGAEPAAGQGSVPGPFSLFCVQAPRVAPELLLAALADEPVVLWQPASGPALLGIGEAGRVVASGPGRFAAVRQKAAALLDRVDRAALPGVEPVLLGGFSFSADQAVQGPWRELGDALFRLPRWTYRCEGDHALLLGVIERGADGATVTRFSAERETLLALLTDLAAAPAAAPRSKVSIPLADEDPALLARSAALWEQGAQDILAGIQRGELDKVVQARCQLLEFGGAGLAEVLTALADERHTATRFAITEGALSFVGASPERLISKRGLDVQTEALAGTCEGADTARLLGSSKDLREQQLVVDEIVRALGPLCAQLERPEAAMPRALRGLVHLVTPMQGVLREPCHVLDLVEVLHPTPAVGGLPTNRALNWIETNEPDPRGWYAAPFGWIDARGDGEFLVALRSALLNGAEARLYAGAGIVAGSDPVREFAEVNLKLQTMRAALARSAG
ncbi:MAG: isochorismate synthase [Rickettsiales bacterium]|nr:isochorismate synthase [Rickettsiales bacterium]